MKVSVIIPTINDVHLVRTVNEISKAAKDGKDIEYIIINDGGDFPALSDCKIENIRLINNIRQMGRRKSINDAVNMSRGEYIFILDAHCNMTKEWDVKLIESAGDKNISYAVIRDIFPDTWEYRPGWYAHVSVNREYTEKWWHRKDRTDCGIEEESMGFTGCAWMIKKARFLELGGYDESLGPYGWDGPEWSLKTWFNGGRVILRTDVICGHIFGTNNKGALYPCKMISKEQYIDYMAKRYSKRMPELIDRFGIVPDWNEKGKTKMTQNTKREVKVNRIDESVTRDGKGEVIKKVIEYFEYIYTDNGNGPTEDEIARQYGPKAKKVREEVWELKDGTLQKVA